MKGESRIILRKKGKRGRIMEEALNVVAQPMMQSIPHSYTFAEDSLVSNGGCTRLYLKLGHSRNGDRESIPRRVYLSVPLKGYALSAGDTIVFRANVYDKGLKEWRVAY